MRRPLLVLVLGIVTATAACSSGSNDSPPSVVDDAGAPPVTTNDAGLKPTPACNATDPRATPVVLGVQPDQGEKAYVDLLSSAQKSIRVFGYQMGYGGILDTLKSKASSGIDVRVILDGVTQINTNTKYKTALEGAGAKVDWSDPQFSYMHAKVIVVDDRAAIVSTGNYSLSYIQKERNYTALLTDPQDVSDLAKLFDADWGHTAPDLSCTRLVVSPINSRDRIVSLIQSAKQSIQIESMQFSDSAVKKAVLDKKAEGIDVRAILADPSWVSENATVGPSLVQGQVPTRWMASPGVHVKAIVVDGARAYLGSENVSYTSLSHNREVGVILEDTDDVATMQKTFEADWATATSF